MPQQGLNARHLATRIDQLGGKGVPEPMGRYPDVCSLTPC